LRIISKTCDRIEQSPTDSESGTGILYASGIYIKFRLSSEDSEVTAYSITSSRVMNGSRYPLAWKDRKDEAAPKDDRF
jgi:hypothetical protein